MYDEPFRAAGAGYTTPNLSTYVASASVATLSGIVGCPISADEAVRLARRMQLTGRVTDGGASFEVDVPPTRPDILHECDVIGAWALARGSRGVADECCAIEARNATR